MVDQLIAIGKSMIASLLHIWPYLLVTIPLAVAVRMSGASKYINRALTGRPIIAILLATAVGAFSPFCSCSVVPVVAALLIGGVPLAPVMSFWIASPSMDPEAFFLSVATIGWELAVWRLASTLILSLSAGLVTHLFVQRGWLGQQILRTQQTAPAQTLAARLRTGWRRLRRSARLAFRSVAGPAILSPATACCVTAGSGGLERQQLAARGTHADTSGCDGSCSSHESSSCSVKSDSFWRRLLGETWSATLMVAKFMALAFFLSALIQLYVPSEWVAGLLGRQNPWAIVSAAFLGVPAYASNLSALPMVSGLLAQGMNPSAGLAFLVSGPTTTLPAMAAVWGLASRRVFVLYVLYSLVGAVVLGYAHSLVTGLP
jgi:uncharacterized membrane protein YraQ (UPF0718 family)